MRHIALLALLAGCGGGNTLPLATPLDVESAAATAYTPVSMAFFATFFTAFPAEPGSCPSVTDHGDGRWTVEGGCTADQDGEPTSYEGSIEMEGMHSGEDTPTEDAVIRWNDFTFEDADGRVVIDGVQRWEPSGNGGVLLSDFGFEGESTAEPELDGEWRFRDHRYAMPSETVDSPELSYDLSGHVDGPDGGYDVEGSGANDSNACDSEPVRGELEIRGDQRVTLRFDGAESCDGVTPYDGDLQGQIDWQGSYPLGCSAVPAGSLSWIGLLGALAIRRRRVNRAG